MYKTEVTLKNEAGLHARPANLFVKKAAKFSSNVFVEKDNKEYNAKSIIGILSMGAGKGDKIIVKADGEDEKEAVKALKELIDNNFDE